MAVLFQDVFILNDVFLLSVECIEYEIEVTAVLFYRIVGFDEFYLMNIRLFTSHVINIQKIKCEFRYKNG